jgi:hypothetical protein
MVKRDTKLATIDERLAELERQLREELGADLQVPLMAGGEE